MATVRWVAREQVGHPEQVVISLLFSAANIQERWRRSQKTSAASTLISGWRRKMRGFTVYREIFVSSIDSIPRMVRVVCFVLDVGFTDQGVLSVELSVYA